MEIINYTHVIIVRAIESCLYVRFFWVQLLHFYPKIEIQVVLYPGKTYSFKF